MVQAGLLAVLPRGSWLAVSELTTLAVFAGLAVVLTRARRGEGAEAGVDAEGERLPSNRMRAAYELAQRGVPAARIAEHCDVPLALAELVVADARAAGGRS
jgi:hypothetical protein